MVYRLKIIDAAAQAKILNDAGEKVPYLKAYGGHFNNNPGLQWAVDEEADSYLFWSPRLLMDRRFFYYLFHSGRMYSLVLDSESSAKISSLEEGVELNSPSLSKVIREAFAVYGVYGHADDSGLKVKAIL